MEISFAQWKNKLQHAHTAKITTNKIKTTNDNWGVHIVYTKLNANEDNVFSHFTLINHFWGTVFEHIHVTFVCPSMVLLITSTRHQAGVWDLLSSDVAEANLNNILYFLKTDKKMGSRLFATYMRILFLCPVPVEWYCVAWFLLVDLLKKLSTLSYSYTL